MAEENLSPISAPKPPAVNPLGAATSAHASTLKLKPVIRKPTLGGAKPGVNPGLKLPTQVGVPKPAAPAAPDSMEQLKSVTQKLKGITQEIPQQAILRKTGIIADGAMSEAQKEAAKHKTARISLSDAMGVAPVKNENAPMKTIRIKRPSDIAGGTSRLPAQPAAKPAAVAPAAPAAKPEAPAAPADTAAAPAAKSAATTQPVSVTQRKTLKISRPGGPVRPSGKFTVKRPGADAAKPPADAAKPPADGDVADIPDIPSMPQAPVPVQAVDDVAGWVQTLSMIVQLAACVAIGVLAWFLYQNTQTNYF